MPSESREHLYQLSFRTLVLIGVATVFGTVLTPPSALGECVSSIASFAEQVSAASATLSALAMYLPCTPAMRLPCACRALAVRMPCTSAPLCPITPVCVPHFCSLDLRHLCTKAIHRLHSTLHVSPAPITMP